MASESGRACIFCAIIAGQTPADGVLDEAEVVAFLDARPVFPGHVLIVPRTHHETLADLPASLLGPLFEAAQRLSVALPKALGADGTFVAVNNVVSQSVPHLHIHVVPRRRGGGLRGFFWPRQRYPDPETSSQVAADIRAALEVVT